MSALLEAWSRLPLWAKVAVIGGGAVAANEVYSRVTAKSVEGEVVVITGAGSGIGLLMARKFAALHARVVLWDVNEEAVTTAAREISESGGDARAFVVDVTNRARIAEVADQIRADMGQVDILINNAGIVSGKGLLDNSPEAIQRTFEVNTLSHFWTVKAFLPDMIQRDHGHIVTISSASAFVGVPGLADYAASKWAVFGFHESLRMELKKLKKYGVHTTCVCPYYIATGMFEGVRSTNPLFSILAPEYVAKSIVTAVLRNKEIVILPFHVILTCILRGLLSTHAFDGVMALLGITTSMDKFVGRTNPLALPPTTGTSTGTPTFILPPARK